MKPSRERMHEALRAALDASVVKRPSTDALDAIFAGLTPAAGADPVARFTVALTQAGGEAVVCGSAREFSDWFARLADEMHVDRIIIASDAVVNRLFNGSALADQLPGVELVRVPVDTESTEADTYLRRRTSRAQMGVGTAVAGFADSGAIAIVASSGESRALSLLVDAHVAILPASRIRPSLDAFAPVMTALAREGATSALTLVGGPSKTADIEKVLITGIHGPGRFIVVIVADEPEVEETTVS